MCLQFSQSRTCWQRQGHEVHPESASSQAVQPLVSYAIDTSFMMLARRDGSDGTGSVEAIDLVQEVLSLSCFAPSSEGWFRTLCCKKLNWFESEGQFERGLVRGGLDGTGQVEAIDLVQEVPPSLLRQVTSQNSNQDSNFRSVLV